MEELHNRVRNLDKEIRIAEADDIDYFLQSLVGQVRIGLNESQRMEYAHDDPIYDEMDKAQAAFRAVAVTLREREG
jgi:hypothetical protein